MPASAIRGIPLKGLCVCVDPFGLQQGDLAGLHFQVVKGHINTVRPLH